MAGIARRLRHQARQGLVAHLRIKAAKGIGDAGGK